MVSKQMFKSCIPAYPDESISLIQGCGLAEDACTRSGHPGETVVLTCQAINAYPQVFPKWKNVPNKNRSSNQNTDQTFSTYVSTEVVVERSKKVLECIFDDGHFKITSNLTVLHSLQESSTTGIYSISLLDY